MFKIHDFEFSAMVKCTDYFASDHRVHGIRIMPGTTFFDIIYRALLSEGVDTKQIQLKNILFKEPVIVAEDYDRELTIKFESKEDHGVITVYSKRVRDGVELDDTVENYRAEVHDAPVSNIEDINIQELKDKALKVIDMEDYYTNTRKLSITHYEYMRGLGKIYRGEDYSLAEINLCQLAEDHLKYYYLHPVYLDAATLISLSYHHDRLFSDEPKPCIPIFIESFRADNSLGKKCYVYVKESEVNYLTTTDIYYSGLGMYDENGKMAVHFNRLAAKQVRSEDLLRNIEQGVKVNKASNTSLQQRNGNPKEIPKESQVTVADDEPKSLTMLLQQDLSEIIAELMENGYGEISIQAGFYDQGLDSGNLLELVSIIENKLGKHLYPTLLFEYTNIHDLVQYLIENHEADCRKNWVPNIEQLSKDTQVHPQGDHSNKTIEGDKLLYFFREWKLKNISIAPKQTITKNLLLFSRKTPEDLYLEAELKSLMETNQKLMVVNLSNRYQVINDDEISIDASNYDEYNRVFEELYNRGNHPDGMIYTGGDGLDSIDSQIKEYFRIIKALMASKFKQGIDILYGYNTTVGNEIHNRAIDAFMKSAKLEKPSISYKLVEISPSGHQGDNNTKFYVDRMITELLDSVDMNLHVKYSQDQRYISGLSQQKGQLEPIGLPLKDKGVYLITGGMGGIGYTFASHIADRVKAKLVIVGRSKVNSKIKNVISELEKRGAEVLYHGLDVSAKAEVHQLIKKVKKKFGGIDGILHSAGVILDSLILTKREDEIDDVLKAKVHGCINLDEATKEEALDFMVLFSSTAAITGNIGQADYAYANSFLDHYACHREGLREEGKCSGKTLAINWPFWKDGGMKVSKQTEMNMKNKLGMMPILNEEGVLALETAYNMGRSQVLVIKGEEEKIKSFMETMTEEPTTDGENKKKAPESTSASEDIAIIGLSGRYPMAENVGEFWGNLVSGKDCITEVPKSRWDHSKYFDPDKNKFGTAYSKWGGFINDFDKFDPTFFNIAPREAEIMDPQERIFLETVWHTFEDAGYNCGELSGKNIGVYAGVMWGQYQLIEAEINGKVVSPTVTYASVANRISYTFNFSGPSMAIDTMCSSSLTALHLACKSIKDGECEMAVVGGVNLTLHPNKYLFLSQQKFASTDGRCRSFGEGGDGYVPGEGVGAVLLKPLSKAIEDKDNIYAVIKGTSLTHGGNTSGYTVPSPVAQAKVIEQAIENAKVNPQSISYVEAHGTGTSLGDPIEVSGIRKVFNKYTDKKGYCSIGSVKSNIGHLEAAAGIASITKVLLQMKHKKLVPSLHSKKLNPNIAFEETPFYVQQDYQDWTPKYGEIDKMTGEYRRVSSISSFGAGGTNVHVILEEYPRRLEENGRKQEQYLILISGKNNTTIKEYAKSYIRFVDQYLKPEATNYSGEGTFEGVLKELKEISSEINGIDFAELNEEASISEIGFDLFTWIRLKEAVETQYDTDLDIDYDWEELTLNAIAKCVCQEKNIPVESSSEKEVLEEGILEQLAYVSQTGRKPMEERVCLLTSSLPQLRKQLLKLVEDKGESLKQYGIFNGNVKQYKSIANKDTSIEVEGALMEGDLKTLGSLWIQGVNVDWWRLYEGYKPWKISIPVYPFEKKRYWIGSFEERNKQTPVVAHKEIAVTLQPETIEKKEITDFEKELILKAEAYNGEEVKLEILNGNVALVRMEDKKNKNVFSNEMIHGLMKRFSQIKQNPNIKAVVLTGFDNVFSMGGTQEQLVDISNRKYKFSDVPFLHRGLLETEIPVIAAIQGHASGGGLLFGLYADIVVMAEEGAYSAVFMKYGFTPGMGATMILKEKFGANVATEMMYTARTYTGSELKNRNASVIFRKSSEVLKEALAIANMLGEKPVKSLKVLKKELTSKILQELPNVIERETIMHDLTFSSEEVRKRIGKYYVNWDNNKPKPKEEDNDLEILKILEMVKNGELTPEQGKRLTNTIMK